MIHYREIAFVAYAVTRMARARKFYEGVLGLKSNGFAKSLKTAKFIEYSIGSSAHTLAIGSSPQWKPSRHGATVAFEVKDFADAVAHLKRRKIKFAMGPLDLPSCRMVLVRDPDGNPVTLHQRKAR